MILLQKAKLISALARGILPHQRGVQLWCGDLVIPSGKEFSCQVYLINQIQQVCRCNRLQNQFSFPFRAHTDRAMPNETSPAGRFIPNMLCW